VRRELRRHRPRVRDDLEYLGDRYSFGRPLSSYQALKHRVADEKVWLEACHGITTGRAPAVATGAPDAARARQRGQGMGRPHATELVQDCIQLHGGIGVTWEHDLHLYLRRTRSTTEAACTARPRSTPSALPTPLARVGVVTTD
jgi:alkylation response protein AidB-like acyl-CoA dehydrogenase